MSNTVRIAVEGCGHGTLDAIYASVQKSCALKGWPGVDLVIIGGDFQAVRNAHDLKTVSMPVKYYAMGDFHKYYSGERLAPYLTIFIGGNHEASAHMWELHYGGWVAPNIYYMGAANVIRLGPLRIAGLSGIWNGWRQYRTLHYERLPYEDGDLKSAYHVRELDVRKLLQIRTQVDIGLSHDWPRGVEWKGNHEQLFRFKPYFLQDANTGRLGSIAAAMVLEHLRPFHWFSAHLHCKYSAIWNHGDDTPPTAARSMPAVQERLSDEIDLDMNDMVSDSVIKNDAEIDLDLEDEDDTTREEDVGRNGIGQVSANVRDQLPASFAKPTLPTFAPSLPFPEDISNKSTNFLSLDKCLPNRHFLQLITIDSRDDCEIARPLRLHYDEEWLAITRVFNPLESIDRVAQVPPDIGNALYRPQIEQEMSWVQANIVAKGKMMIPENFAQTAPVYDASHGMHVHGGPQQYNNPHTQAFCELLQINNAFYASEEEIAQRMRDGPLNGADGSESSGRGGYRGRDRGRGRGRSGGGRGRGGRGGRGGRRW